MFFSRIRIEPGSLAQIQLLRILQGNVYAIHQLLWTLFPGSPGEKRDFLFRQEFEKEQLAFEETRRALPLFYVVSQRKPETISGFLRVESKEYEPVLKKGTRLLFDLRANPVVARSTEGKERSVKHDVLMDAKLKGCREGVIDKIEIQKRMQCAAAKWLINKSAFNGFIVETSKEKPWLDVYAYQQHLLRKKGNNRIRFSSIDFSGNLTVSDPDKFKKILFFGIGPAKAFGCGLLLVKPV
ncbi:MAG: type I-E CRISPR-associated protein Cas6/Cse3/CasE [Elusimicrobia bacterium RIFOXYB2_FULL_49_7]|nr:MAG: type I-E CRISPR-associated protein Cas6/Cse3/CasE [Elusimicrobia bacterium RIFOXYB2_FULL_49_7]